GAAAADIDEDGRLDAVATGLGNRFEVLRGDGAGGFASEQDYLTGPAPSAIAVADFNHDTHPDVLVAIQPTDAVDLFVNESADSIGCRRGNVNAGAGPVTDVLFFNGSAGDGPERHIVIDKDAPYTITMDAPPSKPGGPSKFVLYKWVGFVPDFTTVRKLPLGL